MSLSSIFSIQFKREDIELSKYNTKCHSLRFICTIDYSLLGFNKEQTNKITYLLVDIFMDIWQILAVVLGFPLIPQRIYFGVRKETVIFSTPLIF